MFRQRPLLFTILALILSSLACNAFTGNVEPGLELPPPSISDLTSTPNVGEPVVIELAPTATLPGAQPTNDTGDGSPAVRVLVDLNVRSGPGVQYNRVGFLLANANAPLLGRDPNTGWWQVACPSNVTIATECWISGGAQYSQAINSDAVPIAIAPPTPTPEPTIAPTTEPDQLTESSSSLLAVNGRLAYADNAGIWIVTLDLTQNPPTASDVQQIAAAANVNQVFLSPDGQKVAYTTGNFDANALHVVNVDGGNGRLLIQSSDLVPFREVNTTEYTLVVSQVQWLPNSQGLAFNTDLKHLIGPDIFNQEDLWTISLNSELTERFGIGEMGAMFDISNGNKVIAAGAEKVVRANLDGSGREEMITFELVNTASEYIYYPQPHWAANGSRAFVAVPNREQFSPDANFTLYEIGSTGEAKALTAVSGNILFGNVRWTGAGNRVAYVASEIGTGALPALSLATGSGGSPVAYDTDVQLTFFGWNTGGNAFIYAGSDFYSIGRLDAAPVHIVTATKTADMQWLTNNSFVAASGQSGSWSLSSTDIAGSDTLLATSNTAFPAFDVWIP